MSKGGVSIGAELLLVGGDIRAGLVSLSFCLRLSRPALFMPGMSGGSGDVGGNPCWVGYAWIAATGDCAIPAMIGGCIHKHNIPVTTK